MTDPQAPGYAAFESREDLKAYGSNALLLFIAQLKLGFDDVDSFAANSLTDGSNDKKCDLVAVSTDRQRVILAQGYMTDKDVAAAPANKASDLNTGVSWLLVGSIEELPATLRGAAEEVREALSSGDIRELHLWYVHNLRESENVYKELAQAAHTADSILRREFPDLDIDVSFAEIGRGALEDEYSRMQVPILVPDSFELKIPGGFELSGGDWSAFSTAVEVRDLRALWLTHKTKLMSPNIRDYLGVVRSSGNINFGIKETAKSQPENFAIFNNGITVLVHGYERVQDPSGSHEVLKVQGLGIVNGGQTTGALGGLEEKDASSAEQARVMARFVKCSNTEVLGDIVRFNNTQNKVEATDFRSKDPIQDRLRKEFDAIPEADYRGGRRGGPSDAIQRIKTLLPDSSVAQSLAAFHGDPNLAYNETRSIWDSDAVYARVFREAVTARHIVFVHSLLKAVEQAKQDLLRIQERLRTDAQRRHATFFSARGSTYLLTAALGSSIETLLGRAVPDHLAQIRRERNPRYGNVYMASSR